MLVAEVEPEALQTRRWADDRQHVGQAGPSSEPGLGVAALGEREHFAAERLEPVEMRRRWRVVAPREFRSGRESQAARHRRDEIALFEIEHGTAEPGVAARRIVHVIAALDAERQTKPQRTHQLAGPGPQRDDRLARRKRPLLSGHDPAGARDAERTRIAFE